MSLLSCIRSKPVMATLKTYCRIYFLKSQISFYPSSKYVSSGMWLNKSLITKRSFMKKVGLNPIYDTYQKKAAKDNISPSEYELIYNGTGENYVRWLSGIVISALIILPTSFIGAYFYIFLTEKSIDLDTYFKVLLIPHSAFEVSVILIIMFSLKLASYSFISKYVLRIYKHSIKNEYACVFINPILPWKNITVLTDNAIKLPNGYIPLVPWYKEYYKLGGYKSIILRERFRRPIDLDRMLNKEKKNDF
ncbi:uncharacterized protein LOC126905818 [Daktulosphaira vitifoliae]|uniref:uncharacterized protein LOC126905818 n=1 Tax=Daktulosphaira vitifoliae TaxID=58002 RepID=UPI0021AA2F0E|nr:uncharacterized protein LOC126905818 [Daktulosphaira vitifoliae]